MIDRVIEVLNKSPIYQSFAATALISIFPIFILPWLPKISNLLFPPKAERSVVAVEKKKGKGKEKPVEGKKEQGKSSSYPIHPGLLNSLLSFAAGGLLGDVFIHLIPHALEDLANQEHSHGHHGHSHSHHGHSHSHHDHHHGHSHGSPSLLDFLDGAHLFGLYVIAGIFVFFMIEKISRSISGHSHSHTHQDANKQAKRVSGILNLISDASHNFTDGLALSASFFQSIQLGISTTVAILIHEIPHEIGDYAILIQSGMSHKKAIMMQFFTAVGAFMGTTLGVLLQTGQASLKTSTNWILPFTAGGFIYVALVSIIPELNEQKKSILQSISEIVLFCVGVAMMVGISAFEH